MLPSVTTLGVGVPAAGSSPLVAAEVVPIASEVPRLPRGPIASSSLSVSGTLAVDVFCQFEGTEISSDPSVTRFVVMWAELVWFSARAATNPSTTTATSPASAKANARDGTRAPAPAAIVDSRLSGTRGPPSVAVAADPAAPAGVGVGRGPVGREG